MSDDVERFNAEYAGRYLGDAWVVRASDYEALEKKLEQSQAAQSELRAGLTELIQHYSETWDLPILQRAESARDDSSE